MGEFIKLFIDYSISIVCLLLAVPLIILLAIAIKVTGHGPVIYSQQRIGKNGKPFLMYKFRSMNYIKGEDEPLLSGKYDTRITPVGRFMRKHKFDEIPNFINVLKGEMSLVGPRPEQQYYVNQIILKAPEYKLLQSVKPGITSWGQVKYGYASDVGEMIERLKYDLHYLQNRSLLFDFKVAFFTVGIIFKGKGV